MKSFTIGVIAIGTFAVAACGGTTTQTQGNGNTPSTAGNGGTASGPDPCTLVTQQEIDSVVGSSSVASTGATGGGTNCFLADHTTLNSANVIILPQPGSISEAQLQTVVNAHVGTATGGHGTPVSGLGDVALKSIAAVSATYAFEKNNHVVIIILSSGTRTGAAMDSAAGAVAQSAAGRI